MANPSTSSLCRSSSSFYDSSIFDDLSAHQLALLDPPATQYTGTSVIDSLSPGELQKLSSEARNTHPTPSPCIELDVFGHPIRRPTPPASTFESTGTMEPFTQFGLLSSEDGGEDEDACVVIEPVPSPTLPLATQESNEVVSIAEYVELLKKLKNGETTVEAEIKRLEGIRRNGEYQDRGCCCDGKVTETSGLVE